MQKGRLMRELVDKQLMLEDAKSLVAMDSHDQHWIKNMLAWIENLPTVVVSDEDCISRRAAIDAIGTLSDAIFKNVEKGATYPKRQWFDGMANAESIIKDLPSVLHPEIIRCVDCIHYNEYEDCIKYQRDGFCSEWARNTYEYWYCSRAERSTKYE